MRLLLLSIILGALSCSQAGLKQRRNVAGVNPGGTSAGGNSAGGNSAGSSTSGALTHAEMRYRVPNVPGASYRDNAGLHNIPQYYVTTFAQIQNGTVPLKEYQIEGSKLVVPRDAIEITNVGTGAQFCFSNDQYTSPVTGPDCAHAESGITTKVKELTENANPLHPVLISAIQFNFRDHPGSKVYFQSAYVEKSPIVFKERATDRLQGELQPVTDAALMTMSYGTGGCSIDQENAVGFNAPTYMGQEYYLSGLWTYERSLRQVFGEWNSPVQPSLGDSDGKQAFRNLFADRVSVFHALITPLFYPDGDFGHMQYPNQSIQSDRQVAGNRTVAEAQYGKYTGSANNSLTYVSTPIIGRTGPNGVDVPNWDKYFIRKLCIKGYRVDASNPSHPTPLIWAMRSELRSPHIVKVN